MNPLECNAKQYKRDRFPQRLHRLLEVASSDPMISSIVSWSPDGKSFAVYDPRLLCERILPAYFEQMSSFKSFQRQLNLYGIMKNYPGRERTTIGNDSSIPYFHRMLQRDRRDLADKMTRRTRMPRPSAVCSRTVNNDLHDGRRQTRGQLVKSLSADMIMRFLQSSCDVHQTYPIQDDLTNLVSEHEKGMESLIQDYSNWPTENAISPFIYHEHEVGLPPIMLDASIWNDAADIQQEIINTFCRQEKEDSIQDLLLFWNA